MIGKRYIIMSGQMIEKSRLWHFFSERRVYKEKMVTVQKHEQLRSKPMQIRHSAKGLEQSKFTLWYANTQ